MTIEQPKFIYHGTVPPNSKQMLDEGIQRGWDGVVYCCLTLEENLNFFKLPRSHWNRETNVVTLYEHIHFFKIRASKLDWSKVEWSYDHDPRFFGGARAITYDGDIPAHAIERIYAYDFSGEEPKRIKVALENYGGVRETKMRGLDET